MHGGILVASGRRVGEWRNMPDHTVAVLIVDDQAPFRRAAATVVAVTPGFDVVGEAETGEEAVEMAASLRPDLVLMDINLPGINGIEATERIVTAHPGVLVVLLSTYQASDLPQGALAHAATYVHKEDFQPSVLLDAWAGRGAVA